MSRPLLSRRASLATVVRWLLPALVLFAVLAVLAWKIARTADTPFVYDLGF